MKLISMTDFVLEESKHGQFNNGIVSIRDYANFLKQPLKLEMFVPCDEDGNVLEEPLNYNEWCKKTLNTSYDLDLSKYEQYEQAKEKVLFEGWEKRIKNFEAFKQHLIITKTIENTIEWDLRLTQNATKQFLK